MSNRKLYQLKWNLCISIYIILKSNRNHSLSNENSKKYINFIFFFSLLFYIFFHSVAVNNLPITILNLHRLSIDTEAFTVKFIDLLRCVISIISSVLIVSKSWHRLWSKSIDAIVIFQSKSDFHIALCIHLNTVTTCWWRTTLCTARFIIQFDS